MKEKVAFFKSLLLKKDTKYLNNKSTAIVREELRQSGNICLIEDRINVCSSLFFIYHYLGLLDGVRGAFSMKQSALPIGYWMPKHN